ncbi:MAG: insulinase family protein [Acidobacteria bacterium]|jgi:zinc protease|nr:insulinase family protein [Acidobacteriota bacterium]
MRVVSGQRSAVGKIVLLTFICLFFVTSSFAQTSKPSIAEQANLVTEFDVNGLKVLVKRRPNSPTVAAGLFIRGGARNITDKNAGIENLMLSAATEGSKKFPRETLRRELARTGSSVGSGVNNDYSALSLATTRQNFDHSWEIFTDIALNPAFAVEDVQRTRDQISTGLREQETSSDNFLQVLQDRIIYVNHPYANDVSGTLETISRFTAKDLIDFHQKLMQTSRLLLVVVGDIDPKDVQTRVAATLGKLPRGDYKESPFPPLDFSKATLDVTSRTLPTNYIQGVFNAPSPASPDYYAMRVAVAVLQSRIYQEVRIKRQLSYAPNAELDSSAANTANIYVTAVDANQAVSVMLNEVNNLRTKQINEETIDGISGHFLTLYYIDQQTNAAQAGELAKYEFVGGGWRNAFSFLDKIRQVKPAEVQAVAQKYMKNIRFVVIGNQSAINKEIFLQNN